MRDVESAVVGGVIGTFVLAALFSVVGVDRGANVALGVGLTVIGGAFLFGMLRMFASGALAAMGWRDDEEARGVLLAFGFTFIAAPVAALLIVRAL